MLTDTVTFAAWIGVLPVWLAVELAVLWARGRWRPGEGTLLRTISMIARDRGWQLTSVVFFWSAMPVHWWAPIGWASRGGTIAFWTIQAALLAWNIAAWKRTSRPLDEWRRTWLGWVNFPLWYLVAGPLAAALLFPQDGPLPWSRG